MTHRVSYIFALDNAPHVVEGDYVYHGALCASSTDIRIDLVPVPVAARIVALVALYWQSEEKQLMAIGGYGTRVPGGVYGVAKLSGNAQPVEDFLLDPPILVPIGRDVPAWSVTLIEDENGITHIVDRVGGRYYRNCADFIETTRRLGLSRRLPSNLDFKRLTPQSRILLVHDRGYLENADAVLGWNFRCPQRKEHYAEGFGTHPGCCAGMHWETVIDGRVLSTKESEMAVERLFTEPCDHWWNHCIEPSRLVEREMPGFTYIARQVPFLTDETPRFSPAIFLRLPLSGIEVVKGNVHEANTERARKSGLTVEEVDR